MRNSQNFLTTERRRVRTGRACQVPGRNGSINRSPSFSACARASPNASAAGVSRSTNANTPTRLIEPESAAQGRSIGSSESGSRRADPPSRADTNCVGSKAAKCQAEPSSARIQDLYGRIQRDWRYEGPFRTERFRSLRPVPGAMGAGMKIATFNINNINRRLPNLLNWLTASKSDVVCLQELKCSERDFPAAPIKEAGYSAVWRGEKTWNLGAILARHREPVLTSTALPGDAADKQARYIEAAVEGILNCCLYLPNGNPQPGPKFDYKLAWFRRLEHMPAHCSRRKYRRSFAETSTSRRRPSTSIRQRHGTMTL